jgi:hypothetical protein
MALTAPRKKRKVVRAPKVSKQEPQWDDWEKLEPKDFGNRIHAALDYYRLECKSSDFKLWTVEYMRGKDKWVKEANRFAKIPDSRFHSTLGGICRMSTLGRPNVNEAYNKYWESLPGTLGTPKPADVTIDKWLEDLKYKADAFAQAEAEEKKKEEEKKSNVHVPTIQERITTQAWLMDEKPQEWLDSWLEDATKFNPKGFDFKKHFYEVKLTQAHARKIKDYYAPEIKELKEVLDPPKLKADATDQEKDWASQLKEAYAIFSKTEIKKKVNALELYMGALDVVINTAKAMRKPRKKQPRSKEKLIAKLKYAINDDKFQLASINPIEIVGCNELWIFNTKTRKIGKYVAKVIDPLGAEREGTGLSVKGTTITQFDEEKSIQKTLRKPEEKLKEFKDAGKRKLNTYLDEINAVDIKLNGRINPDTILLKAVR